MLRPSRIDGARHAAAVIRLIVTRLRQTWPEVRIIVRGDSGFCRQRLIRCCERHGVGPVIGVARHTRLEYGSQGSNPRFIVTNLDLPAAGLYDGRYCQRGEAANRIKEAQIDLFGTRASCHRFLAN